MAHIIIAVASLVLSSVITECLIHTFGLDNSLYHRIKKYDFISLIKASKTNPFLSRLVFISIITFFAISFLGFIVIELIIFPV